jgi:zona occludens toxin (predicted ATPase)
MTGRTSRSSESELPTDPTKKRSRKVLLIWTALAVYFGGVTYGIVHATSDSPSKATSSSASSPSKTTTTTIAPTTTTQPSGNGTSLSPGFSSNVPGLLRASILKSQPNLAALDTFVSIVDDPSYPSLVEVCAQDAGPTSPRAANGYANEVDGQWSFTGFGTAWVPPFPLDLTQTIVNSFAACP